MHPDLAADHEPRVGLAHEREREALAGVFAHAIADRRGAGRERQEPAGARDHLAIPGGIRDLFGRDVALLDRVEDTERDEVAVGGRVGDVAGALKGRRGEAAPHRAQVLDAPGEHEGPRRAGSARVGRPQDDVVPLRVEVAVVPGDVLVHGGASGRVHGDVLDQAFADHPHPAPVAQRLTVFRARSHDVPRVPAEL